MNVDSPTELGLINQRESNIQHRLLSVDASCQNAIKNYKVWWCRTFIQCSMKILEGLFQKSSINPNNPARLRNKVTLRIFQTETPALVLLKARGPLGPLLDGLIAGFNQIKGEKLFYNLCIIFFIIRY